MAEIGLQRLVDYCLDQEGAYLDFPFGEDPICAKRGEHIFAELYAKRGELMLTLRCEPEMGEYYKSRHPDLVRSAYHVPQRQRRRKFTILVGPGLRLAELEEMIDRSYEDLLARYGADGRGRGTRLEA